MVQPILCFNLIISLASGHQGFSVQMIKKCAGCSRLTIKGLFLPRASWTQIKAFTECSAQLRWQIRLASDLNGRMFRNNYKSSDGSPKCLLRLILMSVQTTREFVLSSNAVYSLLADMRGWHQFLDEVIQPHFSLLDESWKRKQRRVQTDSLVPWWGTQVWGSYWKCCLNQVRYDTWIYFRKRVQ